MQRILSREQPALSLARKTTDIPRHSGMATKGILHYSDYTRPGDEFCDIIATAVSQSQSNPKAATNPRDLCASIHQPFRDLFNLTLAQIRKEHDASDAPQFNTTRAILQQSPALINADHQPLLMSRAGPDAVDPAVDRQHGLSHQQMREIIVIDSDDDDTETSARFGNPAKGRLEKAPQSAFRPAPDFLYNITVPNPDIVKHLSSMKMTHMIDLLQMALQGPPTNLKHKVSITAIKVLNTGDLEVRVATQDDFDCLRSSSPWTHSFFKTVAKAREPHKVYMGQVSVAAMGDIKRSLEQEAVIQRLFELNEARLDGLVGTYNIIKICWEFRPTNKEVVDLGVLGVDFAFESLANEALGAGIFWDGKVHPCSMSPKTFLNHAVPCSLAPSGETRQKAKAEFGANLRKGSIRNPAPMSLQNPNSLVLMAPRRPEAGVWNPSILQPSARERSASIPGAGIRKDVNPAPIPSPYSSDQNGKYKFSQPVAEYRPTTRFIATRENPFKRQAYTLSHPPTPASRPGPVFGQPSSTSTSSPLVSSNNETERVSSRPDFASSCSQPSASTKSSTSQQLFVFGQLSNLVPRVSLPPTATPQDRPSGNELRDKSNEDPSNTNLDKIVKQLQNMRDSVISGQRPKPISQGITAPKEPASQSTFTASVQKQPVKRGIDENAEAGTVRDQGLAAKRIKLEEAAQASGLPGLWMPR